MTVTGTNQIDAVCVSVIKQNGILPLLYPARNHRVHQNRLKAIAHQKYGVSQLPMIDRISLKYLGLWSETEILTISRRINIGGSLRGGDVQFCVLCRCIPRQNKSRYKAKQQCMHSVHCLRLLAFNQCVLTVSTKLFHDLARVIAELDILNISVVLC